MRASCPICHVLLQRIFLSLFLFLYFPLTIVSTPLYSLAWLLTKPLDCHLSNAISGVLEHLISSYSSIPSGIFDTTNHGFVSWFCFLLIFLISVNSTDLRPQIGVSKSARRLESLLNTRPPSRQKSCRPRLHGAQTHLSQVL